MEGAIYGLQESPAAWAQHRDSILPTIEIKIKGESLHLQQSKADSNMWMLRCPHSNELLALLTVYVDDLLLSANEEVSSAIWEAIQATWRISAPVYATEKEGLKFCGFELRQDSEGLWISQKSYIQSLLEKYPEITGRVATPYSKEAETLEPRPSSDISRIRYAQALVGEILWLATRSRPDLAFGTSRVGQLITKDTEQAISRAEDMLRYLRHTADYELNYGKPGEGRGPSNQLAVDRDSNVLEVFADASFCPGTDKSQTGLVILWGNSPIAWLSMRQPCASLSTAEAELQSSLDGITLAYGLLPLLKELSGENQKTLLYNDNQGACAVMNMPQGTWRTRHLRLKAAWFVEQLEHAKFRTYHIPGRFMLGDLCTKSLQGVRVRELLGMMSVQTEPSSNDGGESSGQRLAKAELKPGLKEVLLTSGSGGECVQTAGSGGVGLTNLDTNCSAALKFLSVAVSLKTVASKWVRVAVQVGEDSEKPEPSPKVGSTLLAVSAVLGMVGALILIAWLRCVQRGEGPRIQRVRAESEGTDSEWSVLSEQEGEPSEGPDGRDTGLDDEGSRRDNWGYSRFLAVPASDDPRGSLTRRDDGGEGMCGSNGPQFIANLTPKRPRGSLTRRDDGGDGGEGVGSSCPRFIAGPAPKRPSGSSDGLRQRQPLAPGTADSGPGSASFPSFSSFGGLQTVAQSAASGSSTTELREGNELQEILTTYLDDGCFCGDPSGTPFMPESEQDEVSDAIALTQDASFRRATERIRLEIYPNWPLPTPPTFAWGKKPLWGEWEAKCHQVFPPSYTSDFWYHDIRRNVLVRFHSQRRRKMFVPTPSGLPRTVQWAALTGRRRTFAALQINNAKQIIEDSWVDVDPKPGRFLSESWRGRTEFELCIE